MSDRTHISVIIFTRDSELTPSQTYRVVIHIIKTGQS